MKDGPMKACMAMGSIVAVYGIYSFSNPGTDGYVFGTVIAAVAGLGGWIVASVKKADE